MDTSGDGHSTDGGSCINAMSPVRDIGVEFDSHLAQAQARSLEKKIGCQEETMKPHRVHRPTVIEAQPLRPEERVPNGSGLIAIGAGASSSETVERVVRGTSSHSSPTHSEQKLFDVGAARTQCGHAAAGHGA